MPAPRKLIQAALETLSEKTLRNMAEHMDIRNRDSSSKEELCKKLSRDDIYLTGYSSYLTSPELKAIAAVFGIDTKGLKKDDLDRAVSGFLHDYDRIKRNLTYEDVFVETRHVDFGSRLRDWMDARHSTKKQSQLSAGEKTIWQIRYLLMDLAGNSFPGFFESGTDDRPEVTIQALQAIGAKKSADALRQIGQILFESDEIPTTLIARSDAMAVDDDEESDAFDAKLAKCRKIWQKSGEDLAALSRTFAAKNAALFR